MEAAAVKRSANPRVRAAAAAVFVLGFALSLALNWPGQLSWDSVMQLHDGRVGHYNPWHPPVMAWLLGLADRIVPGTGLFILFDEILVTTSLVSLLWIAPRISRGSILVAVLIVALPQFLLYQGIVWKDVLFADAVLAGFVALAQTGAYWQKPRRRWVLLAVAFLLFALAALTRQNGAIVIPFAALALLFMARRQGASWPRAGVYALGAAALAIVTIVGAAAKLAERTGGVSGVQGQWKVLQLYDLVGEVKSDPALQLRTLARVDPKLERLIRSDGTRLYTPARNDTLAASTPLQAAFVSTMPAAIAAQWNETLLEHPFDWLGVRVRVFGWLFFTFDPVQCKNVYAGINGPPQVLHELGLAKRWRAQDKALADYASLFVRTPLLSHFTYMMVALILMVFLFRRRLASDIAMASLLASALAFTASFFVIAIACDYRYLLFLDLAALTAALYCVATFHQRPRSRDAEDSSR